MSFALQSEEVVAGFLRSAILIDDNISWEPSELTPTDSVVVPDDFGAIPEVIVGPAEPQRLEIFARPLIKGFSDQGIVFSPYIWSGGETDFPKSSETADLLIIDWKLESDQNAGTATRNFLNRRLSDDLKNTERLRYIAIYTSEKTEDVISGLTEEFNTIPSANFRVTGNQVVVKNAHGHVLWHLTVISKKSVGEGDLAKYIIKDFAKFTAGFMPNIALASISEIRNRTFEYLYQFDKDLDLAVISHFLALKAPPLSFPTAEMDFRQYVSRLFTSNIDSGLVNSETFAKVTSKGAIKLYLKNQVSLKAEIPGFDNKNTDSKPALLKLISSSTKTIFDENAKSAFGLKGKQEKSFQGGKKPIFFVSAESNVNERLSILDTFQPSVLKPDFRPSLTYGTIICDLKDAKREFFLCIQPLCDAVRLKHESAHSFPFLKLEQVTENKNFSLALELGGQYFKFQCLLKPNNIQSFRFRSNVQTLDICGKKVRNKNVFTFTNTQNRKFRWVGDLKEIYAQEIVNTLASAGSRVGTNKYEWLRYSANKS